MNQLMLIVNTIVMTTVLISSTIIEFAPNQTVVEVPQVDLNETLNIRNNDNIISNSQEISRLFSIKTFQEFLYFQFYMN